MILLRYTSTVWNVKFRTSGTSSSSNMSACVPGVRQHSCELSSCCWTLWSLPAQYRLFLFLNFYISGLYTIYYDHITPATLYHAPIPSSHFPSNPHIFLCPSFIVSVSLCASVSVSVSLCVCVYVCLYVCVYVLAGLPPSFFQSLLLFFFPPRHWTQGYGCQTQWSLLPSLPAQSYRTLSSLADIQSPSTVFTSEYNCKFAVLAFLFSGREMDTTVQPSQNLSKLPAVTNCQ